MPLKCSTGEDKFYLNKYKSNSGRSVIVKCILNNERWMTPGEFESLGRQIQGKELEKVNPNEWVWKFNIIPGNAQYA